MGGLSPTLPHFLRALATRKYRLYFAGQCVSLLGNWMTTTAALWLAYQLSESPFTVGMVVFASQIPVLFCAPFFGVWVDRVDGLKLVRLAQGLAMVQSAALAVFTLTGHMTVPVLLGLCALQGFINALDWPARQALTYRLAEDRAALDNVIALNSITFNLARLIGPAIAGFAIAAWGPGVVFAIDAVSYVAVLAALQEMELLATTEKSLHEIAILSAFCVHELVSDSPLTTRVTVVPSMVSVWVIPPSAFTTVIVTPRSLLISRVQTSFATATAPLPAHTASGYPR